MKATLSIVLVMLLNVTACSNETVVHSPPRSLSPTVDDSLPAGEDLTAIEEAELTVRALQPVCAGLTALGHDVAAMLALARIQ